jgi:nitrite reductase (NADH) large subunit
MRIVIIGNGMVGYKLCEKLIGKHGHNFDITVFGEEIRPAYGITASGFT